MLGTLVDKLTSLFSKTFFVGSVPMLVFLFFSGLMIYRVSNEFHTWVKNYILVQDAAQVAVLSLALFLLIVAFTYVFSTANVALREVLEGKYFPATVANALSQRYRDDLHKLQKGLDDARLNRREIVLNRKLWVDELADAYRHGKDNAKECQYVRKDISLESLLSAQLGDQNISPSELATAVASMKSSLRGNNPELPNNPQSTQLIRDHAELFHLIDYAAYKWQTRYVELLNKLQFDYGGGKDVAPTRMGNISNAASYYAASRYSINLDVFWSRLQKVLQGDQNFYSVLQEAKMQVDFLVSLVWLTLAFTLIWIVLLPLLGKEKSLFELIALLGPPLTYVWYRIAIQNYRAFSDLLRSSIDLYRLDLLKTLHASLPTSLEQERLVWEELERLIGYGDRTNIALQYQ